MAHEHGLKQWRGMRIARHGFLAGVLALAAMSVLGHSIATAAPAGQTQPSDVISAERFVISVDGYEIGSFAELSGINTEVEPSEYWETTGERVGVNRLPGKTRPPTLTLKNGGPPSPELLQWHEAVRQGQLGAARRSASLTMFDGAGNPVAQYWLEKAWPSKLELVSAQAGSSDATITTATFTCEYIQRVAP